MSKIRPKSIFLKERERITNKSKEFENCLYEFVYCRLPPFFPFFSNPDLSEYGKAT